MTLIFWNIIMLITKNKLSVFKKINVYILQEVLHVFKAKKAPPKKSSKFHEKRHKAVKLYSWENLRSSHPDTKYYTIHKLDII